MRPRQQGRQQRRPVRRGRLCTSHPLQKLDWGTYPAHVRDRHIVTQSFRPYQLLRIAAPATASYSKRAAAEATSHFAIRDRLQWQPPRC